MFSSPWYRFLHRSKKHLKSGQKVQQCVVSMATTHAKITPIESCMAIGRPAFRCTNLGNNGCRQCPPNYHKMAEMIEREQVSNLCKFGFWIVKILNYMFHWTACARCLCASCVHWFQISNTMHIYRTVAAKPAPKVIANASAEPGPSCLSQNQWKPLKTFMSVKWFQSPSRNSFQFGEAW